MHEFTTKNIIHHVGRTYFERGEDYYYDGLVKNVKIHKNLITGQVQGNSLYTTKIILRNDSSILESDCTCPMESACKHVAALGLALIHDEIYSNNIIEGEVMSDTFIPEEKTNSSLSETSLRQILEKVGLPADTIPEGIIQQLLLLQKPKQSPARNASHRNAGVNQKSINLKDYFIRINQYHNYTPALYHKDIYYQEASVNDLLHSTDLTDGQQKMLEYIKNEHPLVDGSKLFPLLKNSGFPIYLDYYGYHNEPITINLEPPQLQGEILYQPRTPYRDETKVRHEFVFRMPSHYWKKNNDSDRPFSLVGTSLIQKTDNEILLHPQKSLLTKIIARIEPPYQSHFYTKKLTNFYETRITPEEIIQWNEISQDAQDHLDLMSPLPDLKTKSSSHSEPGLIVEYHAKEQTLRITPIIDYGIYQQDISESIFLSRRISGNFLAYREPFEQPGNQIIVVKNGEILHTKVNQEKEKQWYSELMDQTLEFGLSKTLKCLRTGNAAIAQYITSTWPKLKEYVEEKQYKIIYTNDELTTHKTTFKANFSANVEANNDWLYFDVDVYCGEERVTLATLLQYIESGEQFWRSADGTLTQIENRDELERLARLLKNFHAREEGGFEAKLYQAPELEYVMTSSQHYNAARAKDFQKFMNEIKKGKPVKKVTLSKEFSKILRPYQKAGVEWLYFLRSYRFAGILADDMGLGKTLQALVMLASENIPGRPSLIVCPKTLLYNWKIEAQKFAPKLKVMVIDGPVSERQSLYKKINKQDLIIISYNTLKQDETSFLSAHSRFNYVVLDEAQYIKNHKTKSAQVVKKLNGEYRLALTGTPLENSVSEIWSIFDFLMPNFLGTYEQFRQSFHIPIMVDGKREVLEHLRRKVENFMLRRSKSEVLLELPPKIEQASECHLSEAQNVLYQQILAKVRGEVFAAIEEKGFKNAQIHILAGLTKLRQACNHPALLTKEKDWRIYESTKLDMCLELVDEVVKGQRKVLIFSQFTQMLDIVSQALKEREIPYTYLSGKTKDRQGMVDKFNTDRTVPVFLISIKAGGTGLNLTAADTVIIFDPWWNPSVENQAIDRAHRMGQTSTVNVYRLLTTGTIEEKIQALKQKKQHLFDALVDDSKDMFKKLTWDDIHDLFAE